MAWISTTNLTQAVSEIKAFCQGLFYPKTGGTVNGSVASTGEVSATETLNGSTVTHNLTDKLDEEDYLAGMTWDEIEARFTWDDLDGTSTSGEDTYTPNLNLVKPGRISTAAINRDMGLIDAYVGALQNRTWLDAWTDTASGVYAYRMGPIVTMFVYTGSAVPIANGSNALTTLPSDWRPPRELAAACEGGGYVLQLVVNPSGSVRIYNNVFSDTKNLWLRGNIVYVAN